ncbi:MAG: 50S ribosomal protein L6 [Acidobacteria bacterium]|nr:50S ribosomal protein L6 [Acidobacteriota bacterium]
MSRIGKKPIQLPKGVDVKVGERIEVKGPKGTLTVPVPKGVAVRNDKGVVEVVREGDQYAALHGLTRALLSNAVTGVSTGFTRELEIVGIGYRVEVKGRVAVFALGYSHPVEFLLPEGIDMKVEKLTQIMLSGHDRELLGQTAANMRALRPPDPYKNKGVRYKGELLRKKVGKAGAGGKGK